MQSDSCLYRLPTRAIVHRASLFSARYISCLLSVLPPFLRDIHLSLPQKLSPFHIPNTDDWDYHSLCYRTNILLILIYIFHLFNQYLLTSMSLRNLYWNFLVLISNATCRAKRYMLDQSMLELSSKTTLIYIHLQLKKKLCKWTKFRISLMDIIIMNSKYYEHVLRKHLTCFRSL